MSMVAVRQPYILTIVHDDDPMNPRKDNDNFGKMICWHRSYNLGDEHNYEDSDDLFRELTRETTSSKGIIDYVKSGQSEKVKLQYNKSAHEWEINSYWDGFGKWYIDDTFPAPITDNDLVADTLLDELRTEDLHKLAEENHIILPLYLYDHSGITMNASGFSCPWDSGQVGWIYASYKDIEKKYGNCLPESIEKAKDLLLSEVKLYDSYISGEIYGFQLYENGNKIDSCWGFYGDLNEIKDSIKDQIGDEYKELIDKLGYSETSVDEIIMGEEDEYEL